MSLGIRYDLRYAIAATFEAPEQAQEAAKDLKAAGFHDIWTGHMKHFDAAEGEGARRDQFDIVVDADSWFERLFGEGRKTLHDVLLERGIQSTDLVQTPLLERHTSVLTVDGDQNLEPAAQIVRAHGGHILSTGYERVAPLSPGEAMLKAKEPPSRVPVVRGLVHDPDQLAMAGKSGNFVEYRTAYREGYPS